MNVRDPGRVTGAGPGSRGAGAARGGRACPHDGRDAITGNRTRRVTLGIGHVASVRMRDRVSMSDQTETERASMATLSRAIVSIPPGVETAFREKMGREYGDKIPGIADTPLGLLMRFSVLIATGVKPEDAKRALRNLSRGNTRSENIRV